MSGNLSAHFSTASHSSQDKTITTVKFTALQQTETNSSKSDKFIIIIPHTHIFEATLFSI